MLNMLLPQLEAQASSELRETQTLVARAQARNKLFWSSAVAGLLVSLTTSFGFFLISERVRRPAIPLILGISAISAILFADYWFRSNEGLLFRISEGLRKRRLQLSAANQLDFLRAPLILCVLGVYAPFGVALCLAFLSRRSWIYPDNHDFTKISDAIKQLATLSGALLAAQIAIFNFLIGQILGKFSSSLAVAVSRHRAVQLLRNFSLVLVATLYTAYFYGVPANFKTIAILLVAALVIAFSLTVWVSHLGIQIDRAVLYAGEHTARLVRRYAKQPILKPNAFWRVMLDLGLDWRAPERVGGTVPLKMVLTADTAITGLFNAAHKAISENQQETLIASLRGLSRITIEYTEQRRKYFGEGDSGFGFLNDQFSGILIAAQASRNQYLISHVVTYAGFCGTAVLRVAFDEKADMRVRKLSSQQFGHWAGLLGEAYDLSAGLKRSTAPMDAIDQLGELAIAAVAFKFYEDIQFSFIRESKRIYGEALKNGSAYHMSLCGRVLTGVLKVWLASGDFEGMFHVAKELSSFVKESVVLFSKIGHTPSITLKDPISVLVSKTTDSATLQDVAARYCSLSIEEPWQYQTLDKGFGHVRGVIIGLLEDALARDIYIASSYCDAYFEITLLIAFRTQGAAEVERQLPDVKSTWLLAQTEKLEAFILAACDSKNNSTQMLSELFGVLGILVVVANASKDAKMIDQCKRIAEVVLAFVDKQTEETARGSLVNISYLQLLGAWMQYLGQEELALSIARLVALRGWRDTHYSYSFSGATWSRRGYPERGDFMGGDYQLPYPRNLNGVITKQGLRLLGAWNAELTSPTLFSSFADQIDTFRNESNVQESEHESG